MSYDKPGPTRQLEKIGLGFSILDVSRWNEPMFAGVCMSAGCDRERAEKIARELGLARFRPATVRPVFEFDRLDKACRQLGVRVELIPPL